MNARWNERIATLIGAYPRLLGVSVHNKRCAPRASAVATRR
jgi:hypothetical protein